MSLSTTEQNTVQQLKSDLGAQAGAFDRYDAYYAGAQRVAHLGLAIPPNLRMFETVMNWPRVAVGAAEERADIEGFRFPGTAVADENLSRIWQANNLDEESQLAHLDTLVYGRSYISIGSNEKDRKTPIVRPESPRTMIAHVDQRTRTVTAALRYIPRDPEVQGDVDTATLYLPNVTVWMKADGGQMVETDRDEHNLGAVPVVPLLNRARLADQFGHSYIDDAISLTDATARALTNLQLAGETHAVPQRGVLGATKGDFVDADGQPLTAWEAYFGSVWALSNEKASTFQFSASDLRNFETIINMYAKLISAAYGLPPHYVGFSSDNPASAEGIRSAEARLVKMVERMERAWSGSWEQVMRFVLRFADGTWDEDAKRLEVRWRDPATPTRAQQAAAAVSLYTSGIISKRQAREDCNYSVAEIDRMEDDDQTESDTELTRSLTKLLGSQNAPAEPAAP